MIFSHVRAILITVVFMLTAFPAHATLIDNGHFTADTTTGLDWLDFTVTKGLSGSAALTENSDWRFATASEASSLMNNVFGAQTYIYGFVNNVLGVSSEYVSFTSLFGITCPSCVDASYAQVSGFGLIGVRGAHEGAFETLGSHALFNGDSENLYGSQRGIDTMGIALVRTSDSTIPEPSAIALMGLGLLGFGVTRRKQKPN